jgi:hypothetical protein
MLKDIVEAQSLGGYRVHLRFEDGVDGDIDLARRIRFEGVFAALRTPEEFAHLTVNTEIGTICWPNGADLDPDVLYAQITGVPIPTLDYRPATV